jgi:hypothetical protein
VQALPRIGVIILLGVLALSFFVSMVVAILAGIRLAAELQDERARRKPCENLQPPEWVNGEDSRGGNQ